MDKTKQAAAPAKAKKEPAKTKQKAPTKTRRKRSPATIRKNLLSTKIKLTERQELFAQLFATDREFFGNGTQSYIEAYDFDLTKPGAYATAGACAARLLKDARILERINELIEIGGLNDQFVDKQLAIVITQNADFGAKVSGIREYNKLKKRISDDPTMLVLPVQVVDDIPRRNVIDGNVAGS